MSDTREHRRDVGPGLFALVKSLLLLLAVPGAISRLWQTRPLPSFAMSPRALSDPSLWLHLVLLVLGLLWSIAALRLTRDLVDAFLRRGGTRSSWSARWAAALAALVLTTSAAVSIATIGHTRPPAISVLEDAPPPPPSHLPLISQSTASHVRSDAALAALALLGIGTLGAAALARRLQLLRRVAASLRRVGERRQPPSRAGASAAATLAAIGDATLLEWIDTANLLLGSLAIRHAVPDDVLLVRAGPEAIDFLFATAAPAPPPPFRGHLDGAFWSLPIESDPSRLEALLRGARRHLPALVPVGETSESVYLLNLSPGRRLVLEGDAAEVAGVLTGTVELLRVLPWAAELDVELLGLAAPPTGEQAYHLFESTSAAIGELASRDPGRHGSRPALIVAAPGALDEQLLDAAGGVAGIICAEGVGTARLRIEGGRAELVPFGVELAVNSPGPDQRLRFELLLAEASCPPATVGAPPSVGERPTDTSLRAGEGDIEVRLLNGSPALVGSNAPPAERDAARVIELVAYLALHPEGVSREALGGALFGGVPLPGAPARLDLLIAATRRALGSDAEGRGRLRLLAGGLLGLAPDVTADWNRFRSAAERARSVDASNARALLETALALVDGARLARWPAYDWMIGEGLLDHLRAEIVDAAHHLSALCLATGDNERAEVVVRRALSVERSSEILVRDLMVIGSESGAPDAVVSAYGALDAELASLGGNEPSAETRALYLTLCDRPPQRHVAPHG